jgi:hypothetical protein
MSASQTISFSRGVILMVLLEAPALPDGAAPGVPFSARVALRHAGFNRLAFDTRSDRVAALVFAFGYTPRWEARLDGQRSEVYRANGYEAAVVVPPGSHDVELRYTSPATRIGGIVSLGAMGGGLLWCAFGVPSRRVRVGLATLTGLAVVAAAVAGSRALDGGRGLGTYDRWRAEDAARTADLAYGRPARSSPVADPERLHLFHASRAVDGHPGTSFTSRTDDDPWWEVDLGSEQRVGRITLARPPGGTGVSSVEVVLADDNGSEHTIVARWRDDRIALHVTPERVARRIRIGARGRTVLALEDVAVEGAGSEVAR